VSSDSETLFAKHNTHTAQTCANLIPFWKEPDIQITIHLKGSPMPQMPYRRLGSNRKRETEGEKERDVSLVTSLLFRVWLRGARKQQWQWQSRRTYIVFVRWSIWARKGGAAETALANSTEKNQKTEFVCGIAFKKRFYA
jgi:hypothetical protein